MIEFVIPTIKTEQAHIDSIPYKCLISVLQHIKDYKITILPENRKGFCKLYNEFISSTTADVLVFMHDDIEIHDYFFYEKIIKAHKQYNIVGVAGAASQQYNTSSTPAWHLCMIDNKDGRGFLSHQIPANTTSYPFPYINSSYFGPTPAEVVFIDGVLTSFDVIKVRDSQVKFNETYTFHHYDMSMCADARYNNLSIGVTPIFGIHHGLGVFHTDPLWHQLAANFINDYKDYSEKV